MHSHWVSVAEIWEGGAEGGAWTPEADSWLWDRVDAASEESKHKQNEPESKFTSTKKKKKKKKKKKYSFYLLYYHEITVICKQVLKA